MANMNCKYWYTPWFNCNKAILNKYQYLCMHLFHNWIYHYANMCRNLTKTNTSILVHGQVEYLKCHMIYFMFIKHMCLARVKPVTTDAARTWVRIAWKICNSILQQHPDSKVHGANMGPIWDRQDPGGPHVSPMNFAIWADALEPISQRVSEPIIKILKKYMLSCSEKCWSHHVNIVHMPQQVSCHDMCKICYIFGS